MLAEMEKNKGAKGSGSNQHEVRLHHATAPTLADLGIEKTQAHRWQTEAAAIGAIRLQADAVRWILTGT